MLRRHCYHGDDAPPGERISAGYDQRFATVSASHAPIGADGRPYFSLAGTFTLAVDARTGILLEYRAFAPSELTGTEDRTGEEAARRIAAAVALAEYGADSSGASMELGYSEARTEFPGNTFPKRPSGPTEIRLAWRWKLERFCWQGRFVNLIVDVDVDAGTGKILRTIPQPRDPRLDRQ